MHTRIRFTLIALIAATALLTGCGAPSQVVKTVEATVPAEEIEAVVTVEAEAIVETQSPLPMNAAPGLSGERALASPALLLKTGEGCNRFVAQPCQKPACVLGALILGRTQLLLRVNHRS